MARSLPRPSSSFCLSTLDPIAIRAGVELFNEGAIPAVVELRDMSLLTNDTPIDYAASAANMLRQTIRNLYNQMRTAGSNGYNVIWHGQAKPEDVLEALGTDAKSVFMLANLNLQTLAAAAEIGGTDAPLIGSVPENYSLSFNEDGSAVLTESSSSSSSDSEESSSSTSSKAPAESSSSSSES